MSQWKMYQDSSRGPIGGGNSHSAVLDPSSRLYNFTDYICYVCGITTYRKRIRALRVVDFPFLRHHKTKKGVITMENGEMVAVCLDCYEQLRKQFSEEAKYGIPVDKRQYNRIQIPPPPLAAGDVNASVTTTTASAAVSGAEHPFHHYSHKQQQSTAMIRSTTHSHSFDDKRQQRNN